MYINQFAIYRADQNTLQGRKLWHHTMEYIREKKLSIRIEYYKQEMITGLVTKDETVPKIRERFKNEIEVSDVLVINRDGEVACYFMDKEHVVALSGFIRINPSGAVIRSDTVDYKIAERDGNWMTTDDIIIDGKQYYLLEHQEFRHDAPAVIMDAYGKMVMEEYFISVRRIRGYGERNPYQDHDFGKHRKTGNGVTVITKCILL